MEFNKVTGELTDRIKKTMASVFDINQTNIQDDATPHLTTNWDSMNHIKLMVALERDFGIEIDELDATSMVSLEIIAATIASKVD